MNRDEKLLQGFLDRNLPSLPQDFDEGIGIAFERLSFNRILWKTIANDVDNVLEAPADGLMGVSGASGVLFARNGANVTVASPSRKLLDYSARFWNKLGLKRKAKFDALQPPLTHLPYEDHSFDLVFNYCLFEHFHNAPDLLTEMARVSRKYVLVANQNAWNIGYFIHRFYHAANGQAWDHGYFEWMRPGGLLRAFKQAGLEIVDSGFFDTCPWFDTFDMHTRGKIKFLFGRQQAKAWVWDALPAGNEALLARRHPMDQLLAFEAALPRALKYLLSHHFYVIGRKRP